MIVILKDFISQKEEQDLLSNLKPTRVTVGSERNRVYRYGSDVPYKGLTSKEIPSWLQSICSKVWENDIPDHVTINEYHKGQSIDWHIDSKESGPVITVLSLESDVLMGIRTPGKNKIEDQEPIYRLPGRSLLHMTEGDRWDKQHCIYPVDNHRWSIVFRKGII